jgi:deoxyribose-phosphate aldolase
MDYAGHEIAAREQPATYEALAKMIDHTLLRPDLTDDQVRRGCLLAREYDVATITVRPSDVDQAVRHMRDSAVKVGSVVSFPHGDSVTGTKLHEARDLIRRGAKEIDMAINIGKLRSRQFPYIETELLQMSRACHEEGVTLKVFLETAVLDEELKIVACKIAKRTEVDFVGTSTGFAPGGHTVDDIRLMAWKCHPNVRVKASGGVRTLEQALDAYQAGADRLGTAATEAILDAWKTRLAHPPPASGS